MSVKNDLYTCAGILVLVLAIGLYMVWYYYGFVPFVIGGIFVGIFAIWAVYNSRKPKPPKPKSTSPAAWLSSLKNASPEERGKILEAQGFTKYTDEEGNTRWKPPELFAGLAEAEKVDITFKDGAMEVVMEKEGPKTACPYCGTLYDEKLERCPICGAPRQAVTNNSAP
jgi:hypothetical protein